MSWGTWEEDRRYPSKDGTHMVIVSKRVDGGRQDPLEEPAEAAVEARSRTPRKTIVDGRLRGAFAD